MPALKHFLSLQYLHWLRLSLSTTQFLLNLPNEFVIDNKTFRVSISVFRYIHSKLVRNLPFFNDGRISLRIN